MSHIQSEQFFFLSIIMLNSPIKNRNIVHNQDSYQVQRKFMIEFPSDDGK